MTALINISRSDNNQINQQKEIENIILDKELYQALLIIDISDFSLTRKIFAYSMKKEY